MKPHLLTSVNINVFVLFSGDTEVEFSAAVAGHAGLPSWLSVLQVNRLSPVYIFGTPAANDIGNITLEVSDDFHYFMLTGKFNAICMSYIGVALTVGKIWVNFSVIKYYW